MINVGGYIGESTRSEIDYATLHGKNVRYLEEINKEETHMPTRGIKSRFELINASLL